MKDADRRTRPAATRHVLPRFLHEHRLEQHQARIVCTLIIETGDALPDAHSQLLDMQANIYDEYRCIPLMCYGGRGAAIPGTRPGDGLR